MTNDEIKEYQDNIGKGYITLHGYTSCSLTKNLGLSFMWENQDSGH